MAARAFGGGHLRLHQGVTDWALHLPAALSVAIEAGPVIILWFGAIYLGAMGILREAPTIGGYVRFAAATVALLLPIAATFLVLLLAKGIIPQTAGISVFFCGVIGGVLLLGLLPAWPVAQSLSARIVSPLLVLRATRGHRASLIFLMLATSGIGSSKIIPDVTKAHSIGEAVLIELGHTVFGLIPFAFAASIAASAWQFAVRNDRGLVAREQRSLSTAP